MDTLAGLNSKQQEAVQAINGPVLILAGPGSGKTRVITQRVAYLVKTVGVSPRRILAVTFTNKAAKEMVERLDKLVPGSVKDLTVGTFHSICAKILRIDGKAIGIQPEFVIYDGDDQTAIVKRCFAELNLDPKQHAPQAIASAIRPWSCQILPRLKWHSASPGTGSWRPHPGPRASARSCRPP